MTVTGPLKVDTAALKPSRSRAVRRRHLRRGRPYVVGKNGTCVIGDDQLVACIDADNRHDFVLKPSGSWAF